MVPSPASAFQPAAERSSSSPIRSLSFSPQGAAQTTANSVESGHKPTQSWADKVKGTPPSKPSVSKPLAHIANGKKCNQDSSNNRLEQNAKLDQIENFDSGDSDNEGWKTVHHGKKPLESAGQKKAVLQREQAKEQARSRVSRTEKCNNRVDRAAKHKKDSGPSAASPCTTASTEVLKRSDSEEVATPLDYNDLEQDDILDSEHEKAISAAMEQVESLNKELEEWQEKTIKSAIEHEASLTEEIATEEAFVTALNGAGDTPVLEIDGELEEEDGADEGEGVCYREKSEEVREFKILFLVQ